MVAERKYPEQVIILRSTQGLPHAASLMLGAKVNELNCPAALLVMYSLQGLQDCLATFDDMKRGLDPSDTSPGTWTSGRCLDPSDVWQATKMLQQKREVAWQFARSNRQ